MTILNNTQIRDIRLQYKAGKKQSDLANIYGVRQTTISSIVTGILHKTAGGPITRTHRATGERHGLSKLTTAQVEELRLTREIQGLSYRDLAALFGISPSQARAIAIGKARQNG